MNNMKISYFLNVGSQIKSSGWRYGIFKKNVTANICSGQLCCSRKAHTNSDNLSYKYDPGNIPLVDMTMGQLLEKAVKEWPDREAFVSIPQGIRLTYRQTLDRVDRIAAGLKKLGLKPGDRVGIWGPNAIEWALTFLAITRAGFIAVGINPAYRQMEFNYCLNRVGVSAVIAPSSFKTQNYASMILNAKSISPSLQHIILYSSDHVPGARRLVDIESLPSNVEVETIGRTQVEISSYDPCNIQFTSGTTGQPKAPLLSHRSFVNNSLQAATREGLVSGHHRICLNMPFFHAFGMIQGISAMLHSGSTIVIESPTFNPKASIDTIINEKCSVVYGSPTMWVNMINTLHKTNASFDTVQIGVTGGAYATPELIGNMINSFNLKSFNMIYGLTETTAVVFQTIPGQPEQLTLDTVGYVQHHTEVKVVDEKNSMVPFGTPGQLLVRGYSVMMRYWDDSKSTSNTIDEEGWLRTGDKFVLHENGYGQVVGRIKDMIIRGGENIYPAEIEKFLETHPTILEAQVFGVHDDVYGEEICACIRLKDATELPAEKVRAFLRGNIAHFKIPKYIFSVQDFPKTTSGKIQKFKLKEELESDGKVPVKKTG